MEINTLMINKETLEVVNLDGKIKELQLYIHASGEISMYFDEDDKPLFSGQVRLGDIYNLAKLMESYK